MSMLEPLLAFLGLKNHTFSNVQWNVGWIYLFFLTSSPYTTEWKAFRELSRREIVDILTTEWETVRKWWCNNRTVLIFDSSTVWTARCLRCHIYMSAIVVTKFKLWSITEWKAWFKTCFSRSCVIKVAVAEREALIQGFMQNVSNYFVVVFYFY